eukprot:3876490-Rhodomonas_salina.6
MQTIPKEMQTFVAGYTELAPDKALYAWQRQTPDLSNGASTLGARYAMLETDIACFAASDLSPKQTERRSARPRPVQVPIATIFAHASSFRVLIKRTMMPGSIPIVWNLWTPTLAPEDRQRVGTNLWRV